MWQGKAYISFLFLRLIFLTFLRIWRLYWYVANVSWVDHVTREIVKHCRNSLKTPFIVVENFDWKAMKMQSPRRMFSHYDEGLTACGQLETHIISTVQSVYRSIGEVSSNATEQQQSCLITNRMTPKFQHCVCILSTTLCGRRWKVFMCPKFVQFRKVSFIGEHRRIPWKEE
jgi:hypothetical protein